MMQPVCAESAVKHQSTDQLVVVLSLLPPPVLLALFNHSVFFQRDLQVRPGFPKTSDRRTLRLAGARFLYRSDAFPVTKTSSVKAVKEEFCSGECSDLTDLCVVTSRLRNDLYCVEWDVKLYYTIPYRCYSHRSIMPQTTVLS